MATLTEEAVAKKLREHEGNMAAVGRDLGVTRQAVFAFVKAREELSEIQSEAHETLVDDAEGALHRAIKGGEAWAICFFLKTRGKSRGYVERQELTGAEGGAIQVIRGIDEHAVLGAETSAEPRLLTEGCSENGHRKPGE